MRPLLGLALWTCSGRWKVPVEPPYPVRTSTPVECDVSVHSDF